MKQRNQRADYAKDAIENGDVTPAQVDRYKTLESSINELLRSGASTRPIKAGLMAPMFRLRDSSGKLVSSDQLWKEGPLVVVFYRGDWCGYCANELAEIEKAMPEFDRLGARVVAISPQIPPSGIESGYPLTRLRDPHNDVAAKFGIRYALTTEIISAFRDLGINLEGVNGEQSWTLPLSALYVVSSAGFILYSEVHTNYAKHAAPHSALVVLRAHQRH